ncbi:MAG TPA: RlpA-like double-psi beta-barrel domain-containing protein [Longimicrobiales bacterium]|nr:RlpA-like double-psi beta-barrel domain-containing protein [Longimicrobiales bacterium]
MPALAGCAGRPPLPPSPVAGVAAADTRVVPLGTPVTEPTTASRVVDSLDTRPALETAAGEATYYASFFDGRRTASGIVFRNTEPWAAHRHWPFGTVVRVTNERNGRSVVLTVVDRLPPATTDRARRTVIDLSQSAAAELDFIRDGRVPVLVEVLEWGGK